MRPLEYHLASNLLVLKNDAIEHSRPEEIESTDFPHKERWQSGRMRVFAKDVTGQKLVHGFESRPLRFFHTTPIYLWEQLQNFRGIEPVLAQLIWQIFHTLTSEVHCCACQKSKLYSSPKHQYRLLRASFFVMQIMCVD